MSRIASAVGASANASPLNPAGKALAGAIEAAMSKAVAAALAEGITDPAAQRERMMAARERVKVEMVAG